MTPRSLPGVLLVVGVLVSACTKQRKPGEACRVDEAICADTTSVETCRGFRWHVDPCRGPGGCAAGVCDQSVALVDDACGAEGAEVCSIDGTQHLRCTNGAMVGINTCRGEQGCHRAAPNAAPSCDQGPSQVGDVCTSDAYAGNRCSADGKAIVECSQETHHMIVKENCFGPKGCFLHPRFLSDGGRWLACDAAMGDVGQPCSAYDNDFGRTVRRHNGGFCSTDGTQLLTCQSGVLVPNVQCPCDVVWAPDQMTVTLGCTDRDQDYWKSGRFNRASTTQWVKAVSLEMAEKL